MASSSESRSESSALGRCFAAVRGQIDAPEDDGWVELALFGGTTRLGRYELGPRIGAGGFGVVFSGFDPVLGRPVAIKLLRRRRTRSEITAWMLREARAISGVRHPNVVQVFDVGVAEQGMFLVMELAHGAPLSTWLRRQHALDDSIAVLARAAEGLLAVHAHGLLHCDVKPANVLVDDAGAVKIVDFGLAELIAAAADDTQEDGGRQHRRVGGTSRYMSPEQRRGDDLDGRSDVFAFATMAGEVLAPHFPRGMPRALTRVLERGRAGDRERRWPSLEPMIVALRRAAIPRRRVGPIAIAVATSTWLLAASMAGARGEACTEAAAASAATTDDAAAVLRTTGADPDGRGQRWLDAWDTTRRAACSVDPSAKAGIDACLDDELTLFGALTASVVARRVHPAEAESQLSELEDPRRCAMAPPVTTAAMDVELAERIARAQAHLFADDVDALAEDIAVVGADPQADAPGVAARLGLWRARVARHDGRDADTREALEAAFRSARVARLDAMGHRSAVELAAWHAWVGGDLDLARLWLRSAEAIAADGLGPLGLARRRRVEVSIAQRTADHDHCVALGRVALTELEVAGLGATPLGLTLANDVAECELLRGRHDDALASADAIVARFEPERAAWSMRGVVEAHILVARVHADRGLPALARAGLERARARLEAGDDPAMLPQLWNSLGQVAALSGDGDAAVAAYGKALAALPPWAAADRGLTGLNLAAALVHLGRADDAEADLARAEVLLTSSLGETHPWTAYATDARAGIAGLRGDHAGRLALLVAAARDFEHHFGPTSPHTTAAWADVAEARAAMDRRQR
jgi:tetratricopeptide (TPR) repeat protein